VPAVIVENIPADFWEGQTMRWSRFTYEEADKVLCLLVDQRYEVSDLIAEADSTRSSCAPSPVQASRTNALAHTKISSRTTIGTRTLDQPIALAEKAHLPLAR
jgi:hypothetical protein